MSQLRRCPRASRSPQAPRHAEIWANDVSIIDLDCSEIETFGDWHWIILLALEGGKMEAARTSGASKVRSPCWSSDASIGTIIHYIYSFDITHSLFMEVCPYFDICCAHCIAVYSRIWMFLLSKRLRWLPPSHPHELYDCSNGFTFIPYTSLTHVLRCTEESIPVVEIQPLIFFKISS